MLKKTPISVLILFKTTILSLLVYFIFRLSQFTIHFKEVMKDESLTFYDIIDAFSFGIKYDLIISSYILILPLLLLIINDYLQSKLLQKIVFTFIFVVFSISFLFSAADIPYYNQFYSRLTFESFKWFNDPKTVFGMVFQEVRYVILFLPFLAIIWFFKRMLHKIFQTKRAFSNKTFSFYYIIAIALVFISLRGGFKSHPLRHRDAFDGKSTFLNALKLNPTYTIEKSYEEYVKNKNIQLDLINSKTAIDNVRKDLNITTNLKSPIAKKIHFDTIVKTKKNVILILMEGMGASKMSYFGNKENRTPFLDSLFLQSTSFTNLYSTGVHTYSGVFGTNYSYPMFFDAHPMTSIVKKKYGGLPYSLHKQGYQSFFFIAGDGAFDNMSNFLLNNHYDEVYTKSDYPNNKIANIYGVSDDYLLDFALQKINEKSLSKQPFLATILTISDHVPYRFPSYYKSTTENINIKATQYADWSLKQFMHKAKKESWYSNTLFVFVSDHGQPYDRDYKIPLTYNHIPLLIFQPNTESKIIPNIASQMDVFPTIMGILQLDYTNNSFGIDLLHNTRKYVLFNNDKNYGVIDQEFLLIANRKETFGLYKYQTKDKKDYSLEFKEKRKEMEDYYKSNVQASYDLISNDLQFFE